MIKFKVIPLNDERIKSHKDDSIAEYSERYDAYMTNGLFELSSSGDLVRCLGIDGGGPEDQTLRRNWRWVEGEINKAYQDGAEEALNDVQTVHNYLNKFRQTEDADGCWNAMSVEPISGEGVSVVIDARPDSDRCICDFSHNDPEEGAWWFSDISTMNRTWSELRRHYPDATWAYLPKVTK